MSVEIANKIINTSFINESPDSIFAKAGAKVIVE
jgi:hypothetical protein